MSTRMTKPRARVGLALAIGLLAASSVASADTGANPATNGYRDGGQTPTGHYGDYRSGDNRYGDYQGQGRFGGRDGRGHVDARLAMMTQRLHLSPRQTAQVRRVLIWQEQKLSQLRDRYQDGRYGRSSNARDQFSAIRERADSRIERVLDRRQLFAYRQMRAEFQRRAADGRGGNWGGGNRDGGNWGGSGSGGRDTDSRWGVHDHTRG